MNKVFFVFGIIYLLTATILSIDNLIGQGERISTHHFINTGLLWVILSQVFDSKKGD